jgi:hypothetical protein
MSSIRIRLFGDRDDGCMGGNSGKWRISVRWNYVTVRARRLVDLAAFAAVIALGIVIIVNGRLSSSGIDGATYLTSLYSAWRAGIHRRSRTRGRPCGKKAVDPPDRS